MATLSLAPRPSYTMWCEVCDGPAVAVYCSMLDERECAACHAWIECPCEDEDEG